MNVAAAVEEKEDLLLQEQLQFVTPVVRHLVFLRKSTAAVPEGKENKIAEFDYKTLQAADSIEPYQKENK